MIRLRPYKECDGEIIAGWITDEKGFYQWSAGELGEYPPDKDVLNRYKKRIEQDDTIFQMTACNSTGPIGYLTMQFLDEDRKVMKFGFVIVDKEKRARGYGRRILKQALTYAFQLLQVEKVVIAVFENNMRGKMCYQAAGFQETTSPQPLYYDIKGEKWEYTELVTRSVDGVGSTKSYHLSEEKTISDVIDSNNFKYAYQPIVDAKTGDIYAYEALMRTDLDDPISPQMVLDYATRASRLYDIEKATFFNVLKDVNEKKEEFGERKIFINSIPGYQLKSDDYGKMRKSFGKYLNSLTVEITEETELGESELALLLERSRQDGFGLAIDDYGTGYSNTTSLLRCLPDCVKIDRLLISDINDDVKKQHFVNAIIEFAHENGFQALAEGVETGAELKTVIQMGVDLIQGFYTARPAFEVLQELEVEVRNEIINANLRGQSIANRKIYTVEEEQELPLMRLALEQNSGLVIARDEFTLIGNENYTASMSIKIRDGQDCRLVLRNVFLESFQDLPCIELGENVTLRLVVEGVNKIQGTGIKVPESSKIIIEGNGDLTFRNNGIQGYGIGNRWDSSTGSICLAGRGFLDMMVESESGIGIGAGQLKEGCDISILSGKLRVELACVHAIGIGTVRGKTPVNIEKSDVYVDLKVRNGLGIGCLEDKSVVRVASARVTMVGSGDSLSGIGSYGVADADVNVDSTEVGINLNCKSACLIGSVGGKVNVELNNSILDLKGEGAEIMGIGSRTGEGKILGNRTNCTINIRSGAHMLFGAKDEDVVFNGGLQSLKANE